MEYFFLETPWNEDAVTNQTRDSWFMSTCGCFFCILEEKKVKLFWLLGGGETFPAMSLLHPSSIFILNLLYLHLKFLELILNQNWHQHWVGECTIMLVVQKYFGLLRTKVQHQRGVDKVVDWTVALLHKGNFPWANRCCRCWKKRLESNLQPNKESGHNPTTKRLLQPCGWLQDLMNQERRGKKTIHHFNKSDGILN